MSQYKDYQNKLVFIETDSILLVLLKVFTQPAACYNTDKQSVQISRHTAKPQATEP